MSADIHVKFYKNLQDNRVLDKNPTPLTQEYVVCDVYDPCDRLDPILTIDRDLVNFKTLNYMYIEEFGRYYFITNISGERGNKAVITGHVDVLNTYKKDIMEAQIIAERSSNQYNFYLSDPQRIFSSRVVEQYVSIGSLTQPHELVLITVSGTPDPNVDNNGDEE